MMTLLRELLSRMGQRKEKGQTLLEYALIISLVVVVVILVLGPLGDAISAIYTDITGQLS